jgi:hypothetical protein
MNAIENVGRIEALMQEPVTDRKALVADLERVRADFHRLLSKVRDGEWDQPTSGTRWTNEQLLFHMVFGYMVVQRLLVLVRLFGKLPERFSRRFAGLLDSAARPFHLVNYYGSCTAASVYNRDRMEAKLDQVIDALERAIDHTPDIVFRRAMHVPIRWDPYFRECMTLADMYRYPGQHYDHHRRQLTLLNVP